MIGDEQVIAQDAAWEEVRHKYGLLNPDDLVTKAQIAKKAGVTNPSVSNWEHRYDDFPAQVVHNLYYWPEVRAFLARRDLPSKGKRTSLEDAWIKWYLSYPGAPTVKEAFTAGWKSRK